jgi:hypothetical protein
MSCFDMGIDEGGDFDSRGAAGPCPPGNAPGQDPKQVFFMTSFGIQCLYSPGAIGPPQLCIDNYRE